MQINKQLILAIVITPLLVIGQLTVVNPGLEGDTGWGQTPDPWENCMPFLDVNGVNIFIAGYGFNATPDTQPGTYGIDLTASEGATYIGFGHIPNYDAIDPSLGITNFQEGFSQELSSPMTANGCPYTFTIDLANGLTNDIWSWSTGVTTTTAEIKVFGGFELCSSQELLWSSGPITNEEWETYTVEFVPSDDYSHILFQCFKAEKNALCGYALADNITPIINTPPLSYAGENQELCENFTYLNANPLEDGQIGTWTIISGNGNIENINSPNTQVSNLNIGDNIFQWSVSAECSEGTGESQVTINITEEPISNAGENQELCENFTSLNANLLEDDQTGIWTIVSGNGNIENINNPNSQVFNLDEGENIFEWTIYSPLCEPVGTAVSVNYIISDLNSDAGEDQDLCEPETILNGNTPNSNESGVWTIISGSAIFENPTDPNTAVSNIGIGENIFEWVISDPCESVSSQVNMTVEAIEVEISDISNFNGYNIDCNGESSGFVTLSTNGGYPPYTYNWLGPNNFISNEPNLNNLSSGLYECIIIDSNGCNRSIELDILEPEQLGIELISIEDMDCDENAHIHFDITGGAGTIEGILNTSWGEITTFIWDTTNEWYFEYSNFEQWDGLISLSTTDQNGCITSLADIPVQTWIDPVADFEMSTNDTGLLEMIEFTDYSETDAPIISWLWDFGDGYTINDQNPTHFYEEAGQYLICLTIEDENGCQSEKCNMINIYNNIYVYIPNIFTVNNDNTNEVFLPSINGIDTESYEMLIYDRWGKLLFSTKNHQEGWNGTYNGNTLTSDIYSYKISYLTPSGVEKKHTGKITLAK